MYNDSLASGWCLTRLGVRHCLVQIRGNRLLIRRRLGVRHCRAKHMIHNTDSQSIAEDYMSVTALSDGAEPR